MPDNDRDLDVFRSSLTTSTEDAEEKITEELIRAEMEFRDPFGWELEEFEEYLERQNDAALSAQQKQLLVDLLQKHLNRLA